MFKVVGILFFRDLSSLSMSELVWLALVRENGVAPERLLKASTAALLLHQIVLDSTVHFVVSSKSKSNMIAPSIPKSSVR